MSIVNANVSSINYFKGIDLLRFMCATGVIFHHSTMILNEKGITTRAESLHRFSGAFFLDVFFIISGFLISLILMKEYQQGTFSVKNFYLRRIIRIWPLYFLVVFVKVLIIPIAKDYPVQFIVKGLIYACTFSVNYQLLFDSLPPEYIILWSICIEEHIYLVLPLLLYIFKGKFKTIGYILIISGFFSWIYFKSIPSISGYNTSYFVSFSYFYYFGIGILIAYFYLAGTKLKYIFNPISQAVILFLLTLVIFNIIPYNYSLVKSLLINGFFGGYFVWVSIQQNYIIDLKESTSKYLGNISYAMYLIHIIVANAIIKPFTSSGIHSELFFGWGIPFLVTIATIVVATLIYFFFERPILKLKKKFTTITSK